jgi:hypothetical protein
MMREITFNSMETYDYVDPNPEQDYSPAQLQLLKKRHQSRIKKAAKEKGAKFNTLKCERCLFMYILVLFH